MATFPEDKYTRLIAGVAGAGQPLNSNLTSISLLADPNADRILFWDDSAGDYKWLDLGTNLSITGTTLNAASPSTIVGITGTKAQFNTANTDGDFVFTSDIGVTVQAFDADLTTWAGLTPSANAQSLITAANYAAMRTLLSLVPGTDVQAFDTTLANLAATNWAANALPIGSGADTVAQVAFAANTFPARASAGNLVAKTITDFGLSLVDDADASAARGTLGLVIGTNVQAWDADLDTLAGLTATTDNFIVSVASAWASRTPAQVKTTLSLNNVDNTSDATKNAAVAALTNKDLTSGTNTFPTFNQNTTGSAAKWTTARLLAGNSVDGSANVAFANKFIVQGTADAGLSGAQFLGALGTGILKNTTTTGVLSIAVAADFPTLNQNTTGSAASFTGALAGDVTGTQGATVVGKINGVSLAGLATGILKNTTTTGVPSIAVAGDFPTLNQNTTGSAATLTTSRNIYGNAFNGSADITAIIASTFGGTGNGFTKFSGPATAEKTFTLPNASAVILTDNAAVTVAQGGTGRATSTTAYGLIAAGTTATGAHQTLAAGATTEILVGGGASALPVWTTATGTGAPVRATSPTFVTPLLGTPTSGVLTNCTGLPIATGLSGLGAANRVPYATSTTALATSAALTFDGSKLIVGDATSQTGTNSVFTVKANGDGLGVQNLLDMKANGDWTMTDKFGVVNLKYEGALLGVGGFTFNSGRVVVATDLRLTSQLSTNSIVPYSGTTIGVSNGNNVKIGGTATRATTEGTNQLVIFNGTAPVGALVNGASLYVTAGEMRVMDSGGTATLISPHDEENYWVFKSEDTKTGETLHIDVEKLLRFVNDHFGLDFIKGNMIRKREDKT